MNPVYRAASCAAAALALGFCVSAAQAQNYPNHPIRMIAPYEPGGGVDIMARLVAQNLAKEIGQSVTVENRPGAGGVVGTQAVVASAPDGYTLELVSTSPVAVAPYLVKNLPYNPEKDLTPISLIANVPALLLVKPDSPVKTVPDLLKQAKAQPGKLTASSSGIGGTAHLSIQLLKISSGIDILHVPYKGTGPALTAVMAGEATMTFSDVVSGLKFAQTGQLRAVAVTSLKRLGVLPDVPTIAETVPGYNSGVWYAIYGPAKLPPAIVATLNKALVKASRNDIAQTLNAQGVQPIGSTPQELARFQKEESERWGKLIKASGMKPE
ncbi:MAG TPA: tripartite tricarboxylate transporter substrate binding protein [Burkholderiales bacterium]|jgi:tripartite-type tricarboxylate transporter receptor subunit TctC